MKLDSSILVPGSPGLCSAREWNKFAKTINTLWNSRATEGVTLTKGEPWIFEAGEKSAFADFYPPNNPVWQIYVNRPTSPLDWNIYEPPESVFLTGPFEKMKDTDAKHLARLVKGPDGRTKISKTFASVAGFKMTDSVSYYQQRMSKRSDGEALVITGGNYITDLQDSNGLMFGISIATGETLFSPFADVEAELPRITDNPITGATSYGETIALSNGILSTSQAGLVLFDLSGNLIEAISGNYIWQDGLSPTYFYLIADQSGYYYMSRTGEGTSPYLHKLQATVADGFTVDGGWDTAGGAGGSGEWAPRIASGELGMYLPLSGWNGTPAVTNLISLQTSGLIQSMNESLVPAYPYLIPFDYFGGNEGASIVFGSATAPYSSTVYLRDKQAFTYTLKKCVFNGQVADCKFFRTRDDAVTRQLIVVGEFTQYLGIDGLATPVDAKYICFIDQDGNLLDDLEWPS